MGSHVYLWHGTSVCWQFKMQLQPGPTNIIYSYESLMSNIVKSVRLLFFRWEKTKVWHSC